MYLGRAFKLSNKRIWFSMSFSLSDVGEAVYLTIIGKTWDHMWYLYTLIGIYLVLPVLKPMYQ